MPLIEDVVAVADGADPTPLVMRWPYNIVGEGGTPRVMESLVVFRRPGGFLLAVPSAALPDGDLEAARQAGFLEAGDRETVEVGPSHRLRVPLCGRRGAPLRTTCEVLLVDLEAAAAEHLEEAEEEGGAIGFDALNRYPHHEPLGIAAREWVSTVNDELPTLPLYVTGDEGQEDEEEEGGIGTPEIPDQPPRGRGRGRLAAGRGAGAVTAPARGQGRGHGQVGAASAPPDLGAVADLLRAVLAQGSLGGSEPTPAPATTRAAPTTSAPNLFGASSGTAAVSTLRQLAGRSPGPEVRGDGARQRRSLDALREEVVGEEEEEDEAENAGTETDPSSRLAAALNRQTAVLSRLAAGGGRDDLLGLASSSDATSSVGVRGAAQRERYQATLRDHPGRFAAEVRRNMARRLGRQSSEVPDPFVYLERFGGFDRQHGLGLLAWSVAHVVDSLWAEDWDRALDAACLTLVAIDQAAMDQGRWDVAWQLTLLEDVPANVFNRPRPSGPTSRAFTPLASQQWVTTALAFLRESDLLQTRREEMRRGRPVPVPTTTPPPADGAATDAPPNGEASGGGRGRGRGRRGR